MTKLLMCGFRWKTRGGLKHSCCLEAGHGGLHECGCGSLK